MNRPCENPSIRSVVRAVAALTEEQINEIITSRPDGQGAGHPNGLFDELHPVREIISVVADYPAFTDVEETLMDHIYTQAPENVDIEDVLTGFRLLEKAIALNPPGFDVEDANRAEDVVRFDAALAHITTYRDPYEDGSVEHSYDAESLRDALEDEPSLLVQDVEDLVIFHVLLSLSDPEIKTRDLAFENAKAHIRKNVPSADVERIMKKADKALFSPDPEPEF